MANTLNDIKNANNEFRIALHSAYCSFQAYITDPFRHDFCEPDCDCDEWHEEDCVSSLLEYFPEYDTPEIREEIKDYIHGY